MPEWTAQMKGGTAEQTLVYKHSLQRFIQFILFSTQALGHPFEWTY